MLGTELTPRDRETKDAPVNITSADSGFILLRSGDEELPREYMLFCVSCEVLIGV